MCGIIDFLWVTVEESSTAIENFLIETHAFHMDIKAGAVTIESPFNFNSAMPFPLICCALNS